MTKEYKLRIPDGYKVESVSSAKVDGKDAIIVMLATDFDPKPGDYIATDDGQVGIKTKYGYFRFKGGANLPFTKLANDIQKDAFDSLLNRYGLYYDKALHNVLSKPKVGDLCIFWNDKCKGGALVRILKEIHSSYYIDNLCINWGDCIKFYNEEQFKNFIISE